MNYESQITVARAIEIVRSKAARLELEPVPLLEASGRTLGEDLSSKVDHPSCDNSALDGYACREADTLAATAENPIRLRVVGDVPAGSTFEGAVGPGEAVSIYTGAPVPKGADAIVGVEHTERQGDTVLLTRPASTADIRPRAQDLRAGERYLTAGTRLDPAAIGLAATMGYDSLQVVRRPRVAILATGDEVVEPGRPIRDGQVYNSNAYSVAALVAQAGGVPIVLPRVADRPEALHEALEHCGGADLLVTSGGVSMGKYDFVRDLLLGEGRVHFWKVAVRPGGPAIFGDWRGLPVFGLPGNPVSSMVVFLLIASAWLHKALGSTEPLPYHRRLRAKAASPFKGAGFKEAFARGILAFDGDTGTYRVESTGNQGSGVLLSMHRANALVVVPPESNVAEGEWVEVIPLKASGVGV